MTVVPGWAWYVNAQLAQVPRIDLGVQRPEAPATIGGETRAVNILLAGTDSHEQGEVARLVREGWRPGAVRSDTIMLLHVNAARDAAYVVSVPRDTWVSIPGHGDARINAAFSLGGPELYLRTMEKFTGLEIDHLAILDWSGFAGLTDAIGGVEVTIRETVVDTRHDITWEAGTHTLRGEEAVMYVRMRHGLTAGDVDRIHRQQNFIRAVLDQMISRRALANPLTFSATVRSFAGLLTLDDRFDNDELWNLALTSRNLRPADMVFVTVPFERHATIDGQSAVIADRRATSRLFDAVRDDRLDRYVRRANLELLPDPDQVR